MEIQHSVSASETFNEKIRAAEEKIYALQNHLSTIDCFNNYKKIKRFFYNAAIWSFFIILGIILLVSIFTPYDADDVIKARVYICLGVACLVKVFLYHRKKISCWPNDYLDKDINAELELTKLIELVEQWKIEKRNFLLSHNANIVKSDHVLMDTIRGDIGGDEKECPRCAEFVKGRAKVCRFCGYEFETN